ncbi:MAG: putative ABC transporter ATP-binding protein [Owenweeksia sp. TMED14]|nr:MAG: putative ABC transporter ATP-binding protein [Owenweeksia sp. TMED14]
MSVKSPNTSSSVSGKAFDWNVLSMVIAYAKPYKGQTFISLILSILLGLLATVRPILIRDGVDSAVMEGGDLVTLWYAMALLFLALFLEAIGQFIFIYSTNDLGARVIKDIRIKLFGHLLNFRIPFFDKTPIGTLVTRTVSDVETMSEIFSNGLLVIFGDLFKIIVMISVMFFLFDPSLVIISLSVIPLLYIATRWFQRNIKAVFTDVRNEVASLNSFVQERLTGMSVVQLFTREKIEADRFKIINAKHRDANIRGIWYFSLFLPFIDMLSALSIGLAIWYGGLKASNGGDVTIGDLTALIVFINLLYRPLRQLADRFNTLQMGMVASERVLKLINDNSLPEVSGEFSKENVQGNVEVTNLSFSYSQKEVVLNNINFIIPEGQTCALVGATGSGKSTLVHLLLGYYPIQHGKISLDGIELDKWSLESLRTNISLVQQDVFLFSDSVRNNVTLHRKISDDIIWDAAESMGIKEFLISLPGGLDYDVKERGGMLSTGQRQLLAFLRAYLRDPALLILDEATSSIDSQAEKWIQQATRSLTRGRTSIVVAHRLATVLNADQIIVLDKGKLVEIGNHEDLLKAGGFYTNLFEKQFFGRDGF